MSCLGGCLAALYCGWNSPFSFEKLFEENEKPWSHLVVEE